MNILVVDDSNSARYVAVKTLRDLGYRNVTAVESGEDAAARIKTEQYDLILLDWNLGGMSGFDLLKRIRADREQDKTAVVMVTTVNEKNNVLLALKVGIQGYFFKPISAASLAPKLKELEAKLNSESQFPDTPPPEAKSPTRLEQAAASPSPSAP
jgi:two-component system, chemotaxis family, chemotaxis protein CheY